MTTNNKDAVTFAEAIQNVEFMSPLYVQLTEHFAREMYKAIKGRICTPERMATLYPVFREINIETDENDAFWAKFEAKAKRREVKQLEKL